MKEGTQTSTFKMGVWALVLAPLIPLVQSLWEAYIAKLPPGSTAAIFAPVITALIYAVARTLQANNERNNQAKLAEIASKSVDGGTGGGGAEAAGTLTAGKLAAGLDAVDKLASGKLAAGVLAAAVALDDSGEFASE